MISILTRFKTPWLVGPCEWSDLMKRKAIVWLCEITGKSILKLTDKDYNSLYLLNQFLTVIVVTILRMMSPIQFMSMEDISTM